MKILVRDRLDRKYGYPGTVMHDPYTMQFDGFLYLAAETARRGDGRGQTAILCDAIVSIEILD